MGTAPNSERGFDATGVDGTRYQIKGRRIHRRNGSRQLSAMRDLEGGHFDILAVVLFDDDYCIIKAALVPLDVVKRRASYVSHTNSSKFMIRDDVWSDESVRDVTQELTAVLLGIGRIHSPK